MSESEDDLKVIDDAINEQIMNIINMDDCETLDEAMCKAKEELKKLKYPDNVAPLTAEEMYSSSVFNMYNLDCEDEESIFPVDVSGHYVIELDDKGIAMLRLRLSFWTASGCIPFWSDTYLF